MGTVESILFPDLAATTSVDGKSISLCDKGQSRRSIRTESLDDLLNAELPIVSKEIPLGVCHYKTGDYQAVPNQRLPDHVYSRVLDCVVKSCTDILLTHNGKVLLGERVTYPQKSWWFPAGGRINPGLSPEENCMRLCKGELGLSIEDTYRFKYVGTYSYAWRMREQLPMQRGTQDISIVFSLELTGEEVPKDFSPEHFSDMKWVDFDAVRPNEYHPALCRALRDLHSMKRLAELIESTSTNPDLDVAELGENFKKWCMEKLVNKGVAGNRMATENLQKKINRCTKKVPVPPP